MTSPANEMHVFLWQVANRHRHCLNIWNGSFQKTSIPPPWRKLEVNPPTLFKYPTTLTIIRNKFFSPPPPSRQQKFPPWGQGGSFLEQPNLLVKFVLWVVPLRYQHRWCNQEGGARHAPQLY